MNPNQDQLAELYEQGKNVYIRKNKWFKKLGLIIQENENGKEEGTHKVSK